MNDVEHTRQHLETEGVTCGPVSDYAWGRVVHFQDPDANELQIYEVFDTRLH